MTAADIIAGIQAAISAGLLTAYSIIARAELRALLKRNDIARRFGLKNAKVLGVVLVTARRRVAEAERGQ